MTVSMTGFAAARGHGAGWSWVWDLRSVNGKGLDLRLRVPDWIEGLEAALRAELTGAMLRGNVSLSLRLAREGEGVEGLRLNIATLEAVLGALNLVETAAMNSGMTLAQATAADVLAVKGVIEAVTAEIDSAPLRAAILSDLPALLADFTEARAREGAALARVIAAQLDRIAELRAEAQRLAEARRSRAPEALREAMARVLEATEGLDEQRIAQELAILAVRQDVTEELDRLAAHVQAARALLAAPGAVGRKFDFLMQEFMREANTLCSKAQDLALTRVGLDLKTVIDQLREQVQNVE